MIPGLGLLGLAVLVLHIWAIVDVLRTPGSRWEAARENQVVWLIVVLLLSIAGPILYVVMARPKLLAAGRS
ncbi:MAG TPA: PLDc N-terminal domain-containing protein [Acidimicrobiia bacterium]|jgi:hypothetical protein